MRLPGSWGDVDVLRLDQIHSHISGNKAFKLAGHLEEFKKSGCTCLLTFGGVWSNHLHALAALGNYLSIPTLGMVRGYDHLPLTPTLVDCQNFGMRLQFCNKKEYSRRYDLDWRIELANRFNAWVIPEGGAGEAGLKGFEHISKCLKAYDEVWVMAGTGATAEGVANYMRPEATLVVVNALADQGELKRRWQEYDWPVNLVLLDNYHTGGFGRCPDFLLELIERYDALGLPLDPVYTAKLLYAYEQEHCCQPKITSQKRTLLIHTGGLQGRRGYM